jgi:Sulfotransferase family
MPAEQGVAQPAASDGFQVSGISALLSALVHRYPRLWVRVGDAETRELSGVLAGVPVHEPIYIAGLARAGSTVLLELVAAAEGVVTHRYRDFPPVFIPYWWNRFVDKAQTRTLEPKERPHGDRIRITPESPEAMEEPLWMAFFPSAHDPAVSHLLGDRHEHPGFERFYRDHIRKLLHVRGGTRYASKGNYNVTRLEYLLRIFPDARFVIPVREPARHVASLLRQHERFSNACTGNPRGLAHLRQVGHFEFGLDRRPINTGDGARTAEVLRLWRDGDELRGWARYWSQIYGYVAERLRANERLREAALVVRYEDLCGTPETLVRKVLSHCRLAASEAFIEAFSCRLSSPHYYSREFSDADLAVIRQETEATAARFGYVGSDR